MEIDESTIEDDIQFVVYTMLEQTISHNIDMEIKKQGGGALPFAKEDLLPKLLQRNIDQLESEVYMTRGYDHKIYLAGDWLMRPVYDGTKMIPTMEYLKQTIHTENVVFRPDMSGIGLREELWNS